MNSIVLGLMQHLGQSVDLFTASVGGKCFVFFYRLQLELVWAVGDREKHGPAVFTVVGGGVHLSLGDEEQRRQGKSQG